MVFRNDTKYEAQYVDSLEQNYHKYYYRIQAIDPFGDLSSYSQIVEGMGVESNRSGTIVFGRKNSDNGNGIMLKWKFTDKPLPISIILSSKRKLYQRYNGQYCNDSIRYL